MKTSAPARRESVKKYNGSLRIAKYIEEESDNIRRLALRLEERVSRNITGR
jgi:enolase